MNVPGSPDLIFGELFEAVQSQHVFSDSKTFVDAVARSRPAEILAAFRAERHREGFDLRAFVEENFDLPSGLIDTPMDLARVPVEQRIDALWDILTRAADEKVEHTSLIPLPNRYIVPGGRFQEIYYWDSFFTMLGLADSGRTDLIRDMVDNFAFLIDEVGFVPNGNRSYYCSRSQPPYFALMVELLSSVSTDDSVYERYLPQLKQEYDFWMDGADALSGENNSCRRVVLSPSGLLNRHWDDQAIPRQESHAEDLALAASVSRDAEQLFRDVRAGAESGWDYSSRWFADAKTMATIHTTQVVPVDLNSLLWNLEDTLARVCELCGLSSDARHYARRAEDRKALLQTLFFDDTSGMFMDIALPDFRVTGVQSIAATYPLYFGVASRTQGASVASKINRDFLKSGGWVTTNNRTGQQWDSPNGWAPMQWITYCGLSRYGFADEASEGARRWVRNNIAIYESTGRLLEKYNVESSGHAGTGGEYDVQDGFGWTNAILLRLLRKLDR